VPDTIARRFAVTEVLAVAVTLALVALFNTFGGVWSKHPLDRSGLLNEATDIFHIIEAAPPGMRQTLAAASATEVFHVDWYPTASRASTALMARRHGGHNGYAQTKVAAQLNRAVVTLRPGGGESVPEGLGYDGSKAAVPYMLAVQLNDGSWLVFTAPNRVWGVGRIAHWVIWLVLLALSITIVTTLLARQFSAPMEQLAAAVRRFGVDAQAPPIPETGPRELRQVVKTFNAMQARIQKFVAYRTMMLAAISHDLRTPLTRMRLRGEFIEDLEQQARLFRDVDEMRVMVDGALAFFRDDAVAETTTTFDLPHILLTIANDCADQQIEVTYCGLPHAVCQGRPSALKRAFTNLVENAIKYGTPPQIELSREDTSFIVTVRDRGPGIPQEALEHVFRPYFRLDKSRNRATGGVGLGLTVVQAIIQEHGGEIVLANRPGGGLEARVTLPVTAPAGKPSPMANRVPEQSQAPRLDGRTLALDRLYPRKRSRRA
jgi:signal transduction histidine kinase